MYKKGILVLAGIFLFFGCNIAQANVIINEVQLNPTEERFIELYNSSDSAVNLTDWYIQRKTQTGSAFGSLVSKTYFENKIINAGGYFLISRSPMDNADIILGSLTLTESNVIQIKNSEGEIVNVVCWGETSDCNGSEIPNPAEGQSIQKGQDGLWQAASPTPGTVNQNSASSAVSDNEESGGNNNEDNSASNTTESKIAETLKIKTKITAQTLAFAGIPIEFSAGTTGYSGEALLYGKYFWNFGDGDAKEAKASDTAKFTHTFFYEGEYTVALEYYANNYFGSPDASDKITVKAVLADISISKVGDEKDFFVEISNNTGYDAGLSGWALKSAEKKFILPKNTILKAKSKMIISSKITNFSISDKNSLKLINAQGETVFEYPFSAKPVKTSAKNPVLSEISVIENENENLPENNLNAEMPASTSTSLGGPVDNLLAGAVKSEASEGNNFIYGIGLFAFLGIGTSATYFIRNHNRKTTPKTVGDDFEILSE